MKILTTILVLLATVSLTSFHHGIKTKGDSIKKDIKNFEKKVFVLPIDEEIDTTAYYTSVFKYSSSQKIRSNSSFGMKTEAYKKWEIDSISGKKITQDVLQNFPKESNMINLNQLIISKSELFEKLRTHSLDIYIGRYITGFDKKYLVIRSASIISTTDSRQTGPSYFVETYEYYERKN